MAAKATKKTVKRPTKSAAKPAADTAAKVAKPKTGAEKVAAKVAKKATKAAKSTKAVSKPASTKVTKATDAPVEKAKETATKAKSAKAPTKRGATTKAKQSPAAPKAPTVIQFTGKSTKVAKLSEVNPYDKKLHPMQHGIAAELLRGKEVTWTELFDKFSMSNRTLGNVVKALRMSGVAIENYHSGDSRTVYRAVAGAKLTRQEIVPL